MASCSWKPVSGVMKSKEREQEREMRLTAATERPPAPHGFLCRTREAQRDPAGGNSVAHTGRGCSGRLRRFPVRRGEMFWNAGQ